MFNNKSNDPIYEDIIKATAYDAAPENEADTQKRYTLQDIAKEDYKIQNHKKETEYQDEKDTEEADRSMDAEQNWYNQRFKQLKEVLKCLRIETEFKKLKKGKSYSFSARNKEFILLLFNEFDGRLDSLRRGQINASDGAFYMRLYTGILDIFYDSNADKETVESVIIKLWNILDIPQISLDSCLDSVCYECKKMVNKNLGIQSAGMDMIEKLYWEMAFRHSFAHFIYMWDRFFDSMACIRETEVFSDENINAAIEKENIELEQMNFEYADELVDAYEKDSELCRINEELRELSANNRKKKLMRDVEIKQDQLNKELAERMKKIKHDFILNHDQDFSFPEGYDEKIEDNLKRMALNELLDKAIKDEKDYRDLFPISDIDDLLKRMKLYFP